MISVLSEDSCEKDNQSCPDEVVINLTDPDELLYNRYFHDILLLIISVVGKQKSLFT